MIKRECVDEEGWVAEETFKKTLAVYQVLPGPEAHELCVYFGRLRGGKLGGFLAGPRLHAARLPADARLSRSSTSRPNLAGHLDELFYGLRRRSAPSSRGPLVRLSAHFITDIPLALIAVAGFALTLFARASFVLVLLGGGLAYELWTNGERWRGRADSFSLAPRRARGRRRARSRSR